MKRLIRLACLTFALPGLWFCASCGSGQPSGNSGGPVFIVCTTDVTRPIVFISGAFQVKNPQAVNDPWTAEFRRYIAQSGGIMYSSSGVACNAVNAKDAQTAVSDKAAALRKEGKQVNQTGWTYAGG